MRPSLQTSLCRKFISAFQQLWVDPVARFTRSPINHVVRVWLRAVKMIPSWIHDVKAKLSGEVHRVGENGRKDKKRMTQSKMNGDPLEDLKNF